MDETSGHVIELKWTTRLDDGDGYVIERFDGGHEVQFGPMPPEMLGPFVDERREFINTLCRRYVYAMSQRWLAKS